MEDAAPAYHAVPSATLHHPRRLLHLGWPTMSSPPPPASSQSHGPLRRTITIGAFPWAEPSRRPRRSSAHHCHACPLLFCASSPPTSSPLASGCHPSPPLCRAPLPPPATSPLPRQCHLSCLFGRAFDSPVAHSMAPSVSLPSFAPPCPAPNRVVPPPWSPPPRHHHRSLPLGRALAGSRVVPLCATIPHVLSSFVHRRHLRRLLRQAAATGVLPSTEHRCDHPQRPLCRANATRVVSSAAPSTLQSPTRRRRRFRSATPVPTGIILSARPASSVVHRYRVNPPW